MRVDIDDSLVYLLADMVFFADSGHQTHERALDQISRTAEGLADTMARLRLPWFSRFLRWGSRSNEELLTLAVHICARPLDMSAASVASFLETEIATRHRSDSFIGELAATRRIIRFSRILKLEGMPILQLPIEKPDSRATTIVDVTDPNVLAMTQGSRGAAGERPEPPTRIKLADIREAITSSPAIEVSENRRDAVFGSLLWFVRSLTTRIASFLQPNQAKATGSNGGSGQTGGNSSAILYRVNTKSSDLIVNWFFPARYAPRNFGKSNPATGYLQPGEYAFETTSIGSPPPVRDTVPHEVAVHRTETWTQAF